MLSGSMVNILVSNPAGANIELLITDQDLGIISYNEYDIAFIGSTHLSCTSRFVVHHDKNCSKLMRLIGSK
jgi:hypothetical protein